MAGYGFCLSGPLSGMWYRFCLPRIAPLNFSSSQTTLMKSLFTKVVIDETTFSVLMLSIFISYDSYAHTLSWPETRERLRRDFYPAYQSNLTFWPLLNLPIFYYVPLHVQPTVMAATIVTGGILNNLYNRA